MIPRPETEELVEWIITTYQNAKEHLKIIDIGTGSGCIPVSLKKHLKTAEVSAIDISNDALEIAAQNATENDAEVQFHQLDFLNENTWNKLSKYNIIVSNPPYIPQQEQTAMNKNVTAWEPNIALFVPDEKPLLFYEKIARFGKMHLQTGGAVFMETHKDYATSVQVLFQQEGYTAEVKKDMHGNDRMVKACFS